MRVALADDSSLFRGGLAALLSAAADDVDIVHQAPDGDDLLAFVRRDVPDVAILDIQMPRNTEGGLRTAEILNEEFPQVGVLALSTYNETSYAVRMLRIRQHGIGYLLKDGVDDAAALLEALRRIAGGGTAIEPEIVNRLVSHQVRVGVLSALSDRERVVLEHMAQGRSNPGIAQELGVSPRTVEVHVRAVFRKLRLDDAPQDNRRVLAVLTWLRSPRP